MTKKCAVRNQRLRHQNRCQKPETCKFRLICVPNLQRDSLLTGYSKSEMPWNHSVRAHQRIPTNPIRSLFSPPPPTPCTCSMGSTNKMPTSTEPFATSKRRKDLTPTSRKEAQLCSVPSAGFITVEFVVTLWNVVTVICARVC